MNTITNDEPVARTPEEITADKRATNIADARAMLDFIEAHPTIPFPKHGIGVYDWYYNEADKDKFLGAARGFGAFEKKIIDGHEPKYQIAKHFGQSKIVFEIPQSVVCRKVTVVKEVEEFQCDPLLSQAETDELFGE